MYLGDLIASGKGKSDKAIAELGAYSSSSAIDFLDELGLHLNRVIQCGGHTVIVSVFLESKNTSISER